MNLMFELNKKQIRKGIPNFSSGDTVRVTSKVKEGDKERLQAFEGIVISRKGSAATARFTVRKVSYGVGVERVFPLHSPMIEKIEVRQKGKVRRAKLYYLRDLTGKAARIEGIEAGVGTAVKEEATGAATTAPVEQTAAPAA